MELCGKRRLHLNMLCEVFQHLESTIEAARFESISGPLAKQSISNTTLGNLANSLKVMFTTTRELMDA